MGTSFSELGAWPRVVWSKSPPIRVPSVEDTYPNPVLCFISWLPRGSGQVADAIFHVITPNGVVGDKALSLCYALHAHTSLNNTTSTTNMYVGPVLPDTPYYGQLDVGGRHAGRGA